MSDDKIISLAKETNSALVRTPEDVLKEALEAVHKEGVLEEGTKILVLALDDTNNRYNIEFFQAGMRMTECISLMEIAKTEFLREMGYLE